MSFLTMTKLGAVRIGLSGWTYRPWRGVFYPEGLPQRQELAYASRRFPSIEINGTFYGLQKPDAFLRWREETPGGFVFSIKGSRYITHLLRLKDVRVPLANFFASGLLRLGPKLGPILWQLPPNFRFDADRLASFLALLPEDTDQALDLARQHDSRVNDRCWLKHQGNQPMRHALEIRNDSFRSTRFVELLREHRVGLVCADTVEWPRLMDVTADFVYCRLHGSQELYVSGYDDDALKTWAERVSAWVRGEEPVDAERVTAPLSPSKKGRDVYLYFDNDVKVRAPADAHMLAQRLGLLVGAESKDVSTGAPRKLSTLEKPRRHWPPISSAQ